MSRLTQDDIAQAGEYVLGLLEGAETAVAQARAASDPDFAAEVEAWRRRLESIAGNVEHPAPKGMWDRIEAALPTPTGQDVGNGRIRLWQALTALSASIAAFFAFQLWLQPVDKPVQDSPALVAALGSETGKTAIAARYDAANGELLMTPVALDTGKLYPEIWIVPADGKARSLGMMAASKPTQVIVTPNMRQYLTQGAILAITPEPLGGAPGGKATGPIIASGKITAI